MIVDANILASAFLGRSMPLLIELRSGGIDLLMPWHQFVESRAIARRKGGWAHDAFNRIATTVVEVLPIQTYLDRESEARARLAKRGQPDWPVLAAALRYDDAIWSNDRDFFGVGVAVWSTTNINRAGSVT